MELKHYIGIDPGKSGGIAIYDMKNMMAYKMPQKPKDLYNLLLPYANTSKVICEFVHSMPRDGVKGAFSFGENFGMIKSVLDIIECNVEYHSPQKWQKSLGLKKTAAQTKQEWKNQLKQEAKNLYPEAYVILNTSDSILISHYCYKNYARLT